jgi:hypothetical protein
MARLLVVLREGRAHTAAVAGRRGRPRLLLLRDARPPRAARVAVRVVHLLPGAPPLRVRTHASRRGAFVARVRFGTASRYVRVPAAELVRGALGLDLVAPDGRAVARPALGVAPGRAYSLFVTAATGGGSPRLVLAQDS